MTVESTAAEICRVFTRENLKDGGWVLLSHVYTNWVANKEIKPLSELPEEKKIEYWKMTDKNWRKWKRIGFCQGIYVYDLITNKFNQNE